MAPRPIPTIISSVSPINSHGKDNLYNSSEFDDKSCIKVRRNNSNNTSFAAYTCKSPATTPSSRDNKAGWFEIHQKHAALAISSKSEIILMGDSIIAGLSRYHNVWRKHFNPIRALNFGIGGDRTQHVLWRAENLILSDAIKYIVIHCGTNNIDRDRPQDIAEGIVSIGLVFQEINPNIKIIVTGLLPRDSCRRSYRREKIIETNKYLKKLCRDNLKNFYYMKQDIDWILEGGDLNEELYYSDCLHLVETGNDKFAASIVSILNKIQREEDVTYSSDDLEAESSQNLLKKRRLGKRRRSLSPGTSNHKRLRSHESFHESPSRQSSGNEKIDKLLETPNKWCSVRKLSKAIKSKIHDAALNLTKDHAKFASVAKSIDISSLDDMTRKEARLAKFGADSSEQRHSNNKTQNSILMSKVKSTVVLAKDGVKNSLVKCVKNNVQLANLASQKQKKKEDLQEVEIISPGKVKYFSDPSGSELE